MSSGKQATFVGLTIEKGKFGEKCQKVHTVKNGQKVKCGNTAKYKIEIENGEVDYRCAMHISDYGALEPGEHYEKLHTGNNE